MQGGVEDEFTFVMADFEWNNILSSVERVDA